MFCRSLLIAVVLFSPCMLTFAEETSPWSGGEPVACWTFDEDDFANGTIVDTVGGNNGTLQGSRVGRIVIRHVGATDK